MRSVAYMGVFLLMSSVMTAQIRLQPIIDNLQKPVDIAQAPGHTEWLWVVEQPGIIRIVTRQGSVLKEPFLDIRDKVQDNGGEEGLLGLAFHPDFTDNGYYFVYYTAQRDGRVSIIERYQTDPESPKLTITGSAQEVMRFDQPQSNHNGGDLNFGSDGMLYIGTGDGGSGNDPGERSQDLTLPLGKLLRIQVDDLPYRIPDDNPWASSGGDTIKEIWASGLRNPWRFSFDRNDNLWIADVGQTDREEINYVSADEHIAGMNYGWDCREGEIACPRCNNDDCNNKEFVDPVYTYGPGPGLSITGGYVLEPSRYHHFAGQYVFADFALNELYIWNPDTKQVVLTLPAANISAFGRDQLDRVYAASHRGTIYTVVEDGPFPAILQEMQVEQHERMVLIDWTTLADQQLSHFEIECRREGTEFRQIGIVPVKSGLDSLISYQFVDHLRLQGQYHYRLKLIDRDGTNHFTPAHPITLKEEATLELSPNPARNTVMIRIPDGFDAGILQIISINGTVLHTQPYERAQTELIEMDTAAFERGLVLVQCSEGRRQVTRKLMLY